MARPHSRTPAVLFYTLAHPELAAHVQQMKRCDMDIFSREFLNENDLSTLEARLKLALHAKLIYMNNNRLENGNAHIRRFVKRRVQTTQPDVLAASTWWVAGQARDDAPVAVVGNRGGHPGQDDAEAPHGADDEPASSTGGGGAWRCFCRLQGSNDLRAVAVLYKQLQDVVGSEVLEKCIEDGRLATERHRSYPNEHAFGPSSKQIRKQVESRILAARAREVATDGGAQAVDKLIEDADAHGFDLAETAALAKKLVRSGNRHIKQIEKDADETIRKFSSEMGDVYRSDLMAVSREDSKSLVSSLVAMPPPISGVRVLESPNNWSSSIAANLAAYCSQVIGKHSNLLLGADREWSYLHATKRDDEEDRKRQSSSESEGAQDTECWKRGCCLHGAFGVVAWPLRNSILSALKSACPFSGPYVWRRARLKDGKVFMRLTPSIMGAGASEDMDELMGMADCVRYWHVAHMSFSPYEPMIQEMTIASEEEILCACPVGGEIALKARLSHHSPTRMPLRSCLGAVV
jgi:hypothetical protein